MSPSGFVSYRILRPSAEHALIYIVMAALPLCEVAIKLSERHRARMTLAPSQWGRRREYEDAARAVLAQEFGGTDYDLELHTFGEMAADRSSLGAVVGD